jgi:hypothetical protein
MIETIITPSAAGRARGLAAAVLVAPLDSGQSDQSWRRSGHFGNVQVCQGQLELADLEHLEADLGDRGGTYGGTFVAAAGQRVAIVVGHCRDGQPLLG